MACIGGWECHPLTRAGPASPIPPEHGIASAALIPGRYQIEDGCGHFIWLERPGAVRDALRGICG